MISIYDNLYQGCRPGVHQAKTSSLEQAVLQHRNVFSNQSLPTSPSGFANIIKPFVRISVQTYRGMASFGFSVGDIIAAGKLAKGIYENCFTREQAAGESPKVFTVSKAGHFWRPKY